MDLPVWAAQTRLPALVLTCLPEAWSIGEGVKGPHLEGEATSRFAGSTWPSSTQMRAIWSSKSFGAPGECEVVQHYCLGVSRSVGSVVGQCYLYTQRETHTSLPSPCTCSVQWNSQLGSWWGWLGLPCLEPQTINLSLGLGVRRPGFRAATGGFQDRLGRMSRWMRGACPCSRTALSTRSS